MSLRIDTRQLQALAADMSAGPSRAQRQIPKVISRSARRVEVGLRADAAGHRNLPHLARTVGRSRISDLEWEVGFDKRSQGKLAHIIVFGSVNNAPVFSHTASLLRDIPWLTKDAADAAEGVVLGND